MYSYPKKGFLMQDSTYVIYRKKMFILVSPYNNMLTMVLLVLCMLVIVVAVVFVLVVCVLLLLLLLFLLLPV